jgi:adrenodoxin-NADP+ reductase
VAVVGAGPAGFYAAQHIVKALPEARVDIYEKLPVPFGLVRFGVAPDHPEVKNCINTFTKTANNPNVNFFGNMTLGTDFSLSELRASYHAVLLTYGANMDRLLDIPGEHLGNVLAAKDLVSLYNGVPGFQDLKVNLDTDTVVVVGIGNVALDVVRMLLSPVDTLRGTDVTEAWLEQVARSRVERVVVVGRRGPLHVSFTIKELRELLKLEGTRTVVRAGDLGPVRAALAEVARPRKRLTELLLKAAAGGDGGMVERWAAARVEWELRLLRSPLEVLPGQDGRTAGGVLLGVNRPTEGGGLEDTGERETLATGLVLRSIGYRSVQADPSLPFDGARGVVPNSEGRVEPGLYVAGWLATGPQGVIVDTMNSAFRVGAAVAADLRAGPRLEERLGRAGLGGRHTGWADWLAIDAEEQRRGAGTGRSREKVTCVEEMLDLVGAGG